MSILYFLWTFGHACPLSDFIPNFIFSKIMQDSLLVFLLWIFFSQTRASWYDTSTTFVEISIWVILYSFFHILYLILLINYSHLLN